MSSKEYSRIPESKLSLERTKKLNNRTWHNHVMNLLLGKNVCGACLRIENDLIHWDAEFVLVRSDCDIESTLKNIMISTFGVSVTKLIPTTNFCQKCVDTIISAYLLLLQLRENCNNIHEKLREISQQMQWTAYLDDTGSLTETILNKTVIQEYYDLIKDSKQLNNDIINSNDPVQKEIKTHKIILDNESLKNKLLKDTDMHKYLFKKVNLTEPTLPPEITIKKIEQSVDMSDFAPHDLLELNWAEDEVDTENKLQSNEALIMNLMEEAKTVEKHKHFHDNLNLQVKQTFPVERTLHDSLSVKLINNESEHTEQDENYSDTGDLVPQDLLELKWPEEPSNTQTKIPVKKLNFNEALTVKFIPAHKLVRVNDSATVPQDTPELKTNEQKNDADEPDKKHSIDLTKWLHDQGMSTIKSKGNTPETSSPQDFDIEAHISKKVKVERKEAEDASNSGSGIRATNCNITVKNLDALKSPDPNAIRCGLCELSFVLFESYRSHYKIHKKSESAKCYRCPGKFPVVELLVEHLLFVHSEDMAYCTLCYALLGQNRLAKHMVDHHSKKVKIINAASALIARDGRCRKCNNSTKDFPDTPHICVFNYDCTECTKECIHQKYLKSYIEQIKNNKAVYKCTDCEYLYKNKQDIIKHANYMHLQHRSHQCVVCKQTFSTQNELAKHNYLSHFTCRRCKKVFSEKDALYKHNCPKTSGLLSCEACKQHFSDQKSYIKHKETALAVSEECIICRDVVNNKCNMSRHMHAKHQVYLNNDGEKIIFDCTICQNSFDSEENFKKHTCLYECKICNRRFMNKVLHERHIQSHVEVNHAKQSKCNICNLQLPDKHSIKSHMSTHLDYGKCPICLTYVKIDSLTHHIESHEGTTNSLKCPHCVLICENQNHYEVHVNRFHLMRRPYQCDICCKSFYGKQRLREHIKEHFAQRRKATCPVCGKRFARKDTMEKHLKLHSTGQLFNCDLCKKMYVSAALLEQHRMSHMDDSELLIPTLPSHSSHM